MIGSALAGRGVLRWRAAAALALAVLLGGCASLGTPTDGELRQNANEAMRGREYERVVALDSELLLRDASDYDAALQRAIAYDRLGRADLALADFGRAADIAPSEALPRLYRANLLLKMGQTEAALADVEALRGANMRGHERVAALTLEGTAHQLRGAHERALESYVQAIRLGGRDPDLHSGKHYRDALHNAAQCYYLLGDVKNAHEAMGRKVDALKRAGLPLAEDDHYALGLFSYLLGHFDKARAHFAHVSPERRARAAKLLNDEGFFDGMRS